MSIVRKIGLALVGAQFITDLKTQAGKEAVAEAKGQIGYEAVKNARRGIEQEAIAQLEFVDTVQLTINRALSLSGAITVTAKAVEIVATEKNIIKQKAAISKVIAEERDGLTKREVSAIAELVLLVASA